jgi:hypothetical protein
MRDYTKRSEERGARIADVGRAENQPVSVEVLLTRRSHEEQVAYLHDAMAKLVAENARLKATIEAQQRMMRQFFGTDTPQFEAPSHMPRETAQEPSPVHPPCSVTHRGAQ